MLKRVLLIVVLVAIVLGGIGAYGISQVDIGKVHIATDMARDAYIALVSDRLAGESIPFEPDYTRSQVYDPAVSFGIATNSLWLADKSRMIVPMIVYEDAAPVPVYPMFAVFAPRPAKDSVHILGWAKIAPVSAVFLNERYILENPDQKEVYATLVHELVHIHRGAYINGTSAEFESATSAATQEILAGMCNYGDALACRSFWHSTRRLALSSFQMNARRLNLDWAYEMYLRLLLNEEEMRTHRKANRFWFGHEWERMEIVEKYGQYPWTAHVLPGVCGYDFDTQHDQWNTRHQQIEDVMMSFDDTKDLFGPLMILINCG